MTNTVTTEARNASLEDLHALLSVQHEAKLDAVVPAAAIRSEGGVLHVAGLGVEAQAGLDPTAVGTFRPTSIMDGHLAEKLGIPTLYLRKLRAERTDLFDANVNGWLQGTGDLPDPRKFFLRTFRSQDLGGQGIARALLSDSYKPLDNLDALTAVLGGIRDSGADVEITSTNITETRMTVDVAAPGIAALAPVLLNGYRSPNGGWTLDRARQAAAREGKGFEPGQEPVVFAGFRISNSETGGGAFSITPRLTVLVCRNGLTMTQDALRSVHLGAKLQEGQVRWSDETMRKNLAVMASMATDAVTSFLDVDYVEMCVARLEEKAGVELKDPAKTVEVVGKALRFSEATQRGVFDHFIKGGQVTAGGVMNAITAYSQDDAVPADLAHDLEAVAVQALEMAAAAA
jgi:hypothetical protein